MTFMAAQGRVREGRRIQTSEKKKFFWKLGGGAAALMLGVSAAAMMLGKAAADSCTGAVDGTANTITCQADGNADNTPLSTQGGNDTINIVSGTLAGAIDGSDGDDLFNVSGGDVQLLAGLSDNDTFNLTGGTILQIQGNNGADIILLDGSVVTAGIFGQGGSDTITLTSGTVSLVNGGGADPNAAFQGDTLEPDSADIILLNGATVTGDILGDDGNDTITLTSGTAVNVEGNAGDDLITLNGAVLSGSIYGEALSSGLIGNDTIDLLSGSAVNAFGNNGNDTLTLNGATLSGAVSGGAGDDTIDLLGGQALNAVGGTGNDTITLNGAIINAGIFGGDNDDVITLTSGSVGTGVLGEGGNDTITLNGATVTSQLDGGAGDDIFTLTSGSFGSNLLGGDGSDTATFQSGYDVSTVGGTLDGGDDAAIADTFIDVLNINAAGALSATIINWEVVNIASSGTLTLTGGVTTSTDAGYGFFLNSGTLALDGSLSITGNYTGAGGMLALDAALDDTMTGETLTISGTVDGATTIVVTDSNPGGAAAATGTGPGAGIPLVINTSLDLMDGDFALSGGEISKVPFSYVLYTDAAAGIVYLQSAPLAQVFGYSVLGETMREEMPDLRDRLGERRYNSFGSEHALGYDNAGIWVRLDGERRFVEAGGTIDSPTPEWDQSRGEAEVGLDMPMDTLGGLGVLGFSLHVTHSHASASEGTALSSSASVDGEGLGAGLSFAWFAGGGFYTDAQIRLTGWNNDVRVASRGISEDINGWSYGASLEAGNRFGIGEGLAVTPRAQVAYTDVSFGSFIDGDGAEVSQGQSDSLTTEVGVTLEKEYQAEGLALFADASVSHDFLSDSGVNVSGYGFRSGLDDTWGRVQLGASFGLAEGSSAYVAGDLSSALDGGIGDSYGYGLQAGLRINF